MVSSGRLCILHMKSIVCFFFFHKSLFDDKCIIVLVGNGREIADVEHLRCMLQGTLEALNLNGLEPWEIAGAAGLAVLLSYGVYRRRKDIRRAAAGLATGLAQTAQMAVGLTVNPMAAVPGTGHMR